MTAIYKNIPVRESISNDENELVIFASDLLSQPHRNQLIRICPLIYTKCANALPACASNDLVVLAGALDSDYYEWLRSVGLGPDHVVSYEMPVNNVSLSQLIQRDPERILRIINQEKKQAVYLPYYSSEAEYRCADMLGAELFGAREKIVLKYFNKISFKEICREINVPIVEDVVFELNFDDKNNFDRLKDCFIKLGDCDHGYVIRGEYSSGGSAVCSLSHRDSLNVLYERMKRNEEKRILIEPCVNVAVSPSEHWVINRNHMVYHFDPSLQILDKFNYTGSIKWGDIADEIHEKLFEYSYKIINKMIDDGYIGWVGIDFIIDCEGNIFVTENNSRLCAPTYIYSIVDNIQGNVGEVPFWKMIRMNVGKHNFLEFLSAIELLIYTPNHHMNKILPYDCGMLSESGVVSLLLIAEDTRHADRLETRLACSLDAAKRSQG